MRPPNIAIWHFVSASSLFPQPLLSFLAARRRTLVSTCRQFVSVTAALLSVLVLDVLLADDLLVHCTDPRD